MMRATGIDPSQVRLGNAIPYRPIVTGKGGTRRSWTPTRAEIDRSSGQLLQDVERSEPGAILALGRSAMAAFGIRSSIEQARGRAFRRAGMPLLATYHPQYVAYRGGEHGLVWRTMACDLARAWRASTPSASKDRPGR